MMDDDEQDDLSTDELRILLAAIVQEERAIQAELAELLKKIKRTCRPEFAERVETHLRSSGVLPPNDKARQ
jgi:hypothetical protein